MRVLLVGAASAIARAVTARLAIDGAAVVGVDLLPAQGGVDHAIV